MSVDGQLFRKLVNVCLEHTQKVLLNEKQLTTIDKVPHKYTDKYLITDYLGVTAIVCYLNCLSELGLSPENLSLLVSWSQSVNVTLRLEVNKSCIFVKEIKREVVNPTRYQIEEVGFSLTNSKVITTVTEYLYVFSARYELVAYRGVLDSSIDRIVLQSRLSAQDIVTCGKSSPYSAASMKHFDLNISWLLHRIDSQSRLASFCIDRDRADCHTPARNEQVLSALTFFMEAATWSNDVIEYFKTDLFEVQRAFGRSKVEQDLDSITAVDVFVPVFPLVSKEASSASSSTMGSETEIASMTVESGGHLALGDANASAESIDMTGVGDNTAAICDPTPELILTATLVSQLLSEQARSLKAKLDSLSLLFPPSDSTTVSAAFDNYNGDIASNSPIVSVAEAKLLVVLHHLQRVAKLFRASIFDIEDMLRNQIVAAVGKTLTPSDFTAYMAYHNRKLFKEEFQPRPFSHAVRRTAQHSPEGSIRIEEQAPSRYSSPATASEPIYTSCCSKSGCDAPLMRLALNASTNVTFGGERHLHTWLGHSFSGQAQPSLKLVAQARQFSSFIVLVGCVVSAHEFKPKFGMIVRNKDEISIPLDLEQIPTRKEFRDAIESLSPEQQRFAKAFRGMQLESTLFGVLVLQIKPQLEMVLKLPTDTLTKEIELTQALLELFIEYQIPSDLLSVSELDTVNDTAKTRIESVQSNVDAMNDMIYSTKKRAITQLAQRNKVLGNPASVSEPANKRQRWSETVNVMSRETQTASGNVSYGARRDSGDYSSDIDYDEEDGDFEYGETCMAPSSASSCGKSTVLRSDKGQEQQHNIKQEQDTEKSSQGDVRWDDASSNPSTATSGATEIRVVDYTKFPSLLDKRYEELDPDSALRPTIIRPGSVWSKKSFETLLSDPQTLSMHAKEQDTAKNEAFDLLDALSNSGALVMHSASLHVVIAATHCFDKSLMDTVVQGNVNPIERVERSALIMASTIHEMPVSQLISENQKSRVLTYSPQLLRLKE
jgi:hypothetical protein